MRDEGGKYVQAGQRKERQAERSKVALLTRVVGGVVLGDPLVFQHVQQGRLAGIVKPKEHQLSRLVCKTFQREKGNTQQRVS